MKAEDLFDSNYNYSSKLIDAFSLSFHKNKNYTLFWGIFRFFGKFFLSIPSVLYINNLFKIKRNDGLVITNSLNQYLAIKPLLDNNNKLSLKCLSVEWKPNDSSILRYPIFLSYIVSLFFLPYVLFLYLIEKDNYKKSSFYYAFNEYCLTFGYRIINNVWFKVNPPKFIIIINDHHFASRDIVKSAKINGIPTFYIQHASVTEKFPKLITDYAFLEGEDAKNKYLKIGKTDTIIELVGILKFDGILNKKQVNRKSNCVGLCTNQFDDFEKTKVLIDYFKSSTDLSIILRPHPGDPNYFKWEELCLNQKIYFSDSKNESVFLFFERIDVVISYNCNILLESVLNNIPAFSYQLSNDCFDHYKFVSNKLVKHFDSPKELINELNDLDTNIIASSKAKYYCDTVDTNYAGRSKDLISEYLNNLSL